MKVTKHESDTSFQGNWHEKKLNKEHEKVLPDLIDELISELDVTYTNANITTKKEEMVHITEYCCIISITLINTVFFIFRCLACKYYLKYNVCLIIL